MGIDLVGVDLVGGHLGDDMDLAFICFQLFPRLEGRNGSEQ